MVQGRYNTGEHTGYEAVTPWGEDEGDLGTPGGEGGDGNQQAIAAAVRAPACQPSGRALPVRALAQPGVSVGGRMPVRSAGAGRANAPQPRELLRALFFTAEPAERPALPLAAAPPSGADPLLAASLTIDPQQVIQD